MRSACVTEADEQNTFSSGLIVQGIESNFMLTGFQFVVTGGDAFLAVGRNYYLDLGRKAPCPDDITAEFLKLSVDTTLGTLQQIVEKI